MSAKNSSFYGVYRSQVSLQTVCFIKPYRNKIYKCTGSYFIMKWAILPYNHKIKKKKIFMGICRKLEKIAKKQDGCKYAQMLQEI